jgi:hypothetical protein
MKIDLTSCLFFSFSDVAELLSLEDTPEPRLSPLPVHLLQLFPCSSSFSFWQSKSYCLPKGWPGLSAGAKVNPAKFCSPMDALRFRAYCISLKVTLPWASDKNVMQSVKWKLRTLNSMGLFLRRTRFSAMVNTCGW